MGAGEQLGNIAKINPDARPTQNPITLVELTPRKSSQTNFLLYLVEPGYSDNKRVHLSPQKLQISWPSQANTRPSIPPPSSATRKHHQQANRILCRPISRRLVLCRKSFQVCPETKLVCLQCDHQSIFQKRRL